MSGIFVGELILWLIVALIVIVVAVYIVNWLYHRSSKEVSFVRTGFLGEQVVPFVTPRLAPSRQIVPEVGTPAQAGATGHGAPD